MSDSGWDHDLTLSELKKYLAMLPPWGKMQPRYAQVFIEEEWHLIKIPLFRTRSVTDCWQEAARFGITAAHPHKVWEDTTKAVLWRINDE